MAFPGVRKAVQAITMGPQTEQDAYNAEQRRLIAARTASATMDKRVAEANMANRQNKAGGDLMNAMDMTDPLNIAVIAELAGQMSSAETARGKKQETDFQGELIDQYKTDPASVTPEIANIVNAITGTGSMMSGSHVAPSRDSRLEADRIRAVTDAQEALAGKRRKTYPDGTPTRQRVTDARFGEFVGPDEVGAFAAWMQDNKDDTSLRDENQAIQKFRVLVDSGKLDPVTGKMIPFDATTYGVVNPDSDSVGYSDDYESIPGWGDLSPAEQEELKQYIRSQPVKK